MAGAPSIATLRQLTKRAQFLNAALGRRAGRRAFSLQAIAVDNAQPGVGFTVTKKAGNSPERNRIRRRLRAAARACAQSLRPQHDYVLVGRREALSIAFDEVVADLASALKKLHASEEAGPKRP
ncbi:MAG: ribonuclease P protein component [Devosia sp.]